MYSERSRVDLQAVAGRPWRALPAAGGWDELVLPEPQLATLRALAQRTSEPRGPSSGAVMALFSGDRGTGKTLAARIIAAELGTRVIEIDTVAAAHGGAAPLAATLEEARREADRDGSVLALDDAAAAFEHDHDGVTLRDRCGDYRGLVVLCSPVSVRLSEADATRLDAVVEFSLPAPPARAALWRACLPGDARIDQSDIAFLAEHFRLSGGAIHACATAAQRTAESSGRAVGRAELAEALTSHYSTWVRSRNTERALAALREPDTPDQRDGAQGRRNAAPAGSRLPWRRRPREQS